MPDTAEKTAPLCRCCGGDGMHAHRAYARGASPEDDWEGCTACHESGRTWHDAYPDRCTGAAAVRRRTDPNY